MKKGNLSFGNIFMVAVFVGIGIFSGHLIAEYLDTVYSGSYVSDIISLALMMVCMYIMMYVQIAIHEGGHLVFGLLTGYKFQSYRIGSFILKKTEDGLRTGRFSIAGTGGQCLMEPPELKDGRIPYFLYNIGGSLANVIASVIFYLLALLWPGTFASIVLKMGTIIGIGFAATNGIPLHLTGIDNDGANIVSLRKSPDAVRAFYAQLKITELSAKGTRAKDMPEDLFKLPDDADLSNSLITSVAVMNEQKLQDMHRFDEADKEAEKLLALDSGLEGLYRSLLTCDRIFFAVLKGKDYNAFLDKAQLKYMKSMKSYPPVIRTKYAMALREKDEAEVKKLLENFDKVAKNYPTPADIESERELMMIAKDKINNTDA